MRIIILVIIAVVVFSALGFWLTAYGNTTSEETNMNYGISMTTDKMNYSFGEPIKMMLKVFNYTEENVVFHFNGSQRYDFIIEDEEGNEIWCWSKGMMFAMKENRDRHLFSRCIILKEDFNIFFSQSKMNRN